jgi:hypothetical protein
LLRNWPVTNPRKEISFLQQFSLLLGHVAQASLGWISPLVLRVMAKCIRSVNSSVALNACFMLLDGQFLCFFTDAKDAFLVTIIPALRAARAHWHGEAKEIAANLLRTLGDDGTLQQPDRAAGARTAQTWKGLAAAARTGLVRPAF